MTTTWYDMKERILELVRYDVENGELHHPAHISKRTEVIYPLGEFVMIPTLEFVPAGWDDDYVIEQYAQEFADGCEWVIYTSQARALWADSVAVQDYEGIVSEYCDPHEDIDRRITLCVYEATRDAVLNAIETIREEMGE